MSVPDRGCLLNLSKKINLDQEHQNGKPGQRQNVIRDALMGLAASLGVGITASALMMVVVIIISHTV